jgi:hypothetical protein
MPASWFEAWSAAALASDPVGSKQEPPVLRQPRRRVPGQPHLLGRGQAILRPPAGQGSDAGGRRRVVMSISPDSFAEVRTIGMNESTAETQQPGIGGWRGGWLGA